MSNAPFEFTPRFRGQEPSPQIRNVLADVADPELAG
jgi:hypothetical protein